MGVAEENRNHGAVGVARGGRVGVGKVAGSPKAPGGGGLRELELIPRAAGSLRKGFVRESGQAILTPVRSQA